MSSPKGARFWRGSKYAKKPNYKSKQVIPRGPKLGLTVPTWQKARVAVPFDLDVGTVGAISKYVFRANSIYDPDLTGTGDSVLDYQTFSSHYNHYVVTGAKITLKAYSSMGSNANVIGIMLNDDTTTPSYFSEVLMQSDSKFGIVGSDGKILTVTKNFSAKRFFNVTDVKDNLDRIGSVMGSNPTDDAYFTVYALPMDVVTDTAPVRCVAIIDYIFHLSEAKDIALP